MSSVASPADRRFRRAHVKPARRRATRAFIKWLAARLLTVLLLGGALYAASTAVARTHILEISRITVRGNQRLSTGDALSVLNGLRGQNIVWTDLERWRRRLLALPWVQDAVCRRSLPGTVEVTIEERQPIGIGRVNGEMYLVDEHGVAIDQYGPQYADLDLPIVDGLAAGGDGTLMTDEPRAELAANVIAALKSNQTIARRLSQIDVTDVHNASVILNDDPAVIHLGEDRFLARLEGYLDLATALRDRVSNIDSVDLRFDDRIYVRPTAMSGRSGKMSVRPAQKSKGSKRSGA
jgi:cell division septal protein FtsQ